MTQVTGAATAANAIAVEVERVAKAQQYLAGLMPTGGAARRKRSRTA
jgi:hypothetical protein